jgi:hypothetical protein
MNVLVEPLLSLLYDDSGNSFWRKVCWRVGHVYRFHSLNMILSLLLSKREAREKPVTQKVLSSRQVAPLSCEFECSERTYLKSWTVYNHGFVATLPVTHLRRLPMNAWLSTLLKSTPSWNSSLSSSSWLDICIDTKERLAFHTSERRREIVKHYIWSSSTSLSKSVWSCGIRDRLISNPNIE